MKTKVTRPHRLLPLLTALGAGLLGTANLAHAQGLYIGGSAGGAHYKGDSIGGVETDRSATGSKLFGGYQLTPNIAVEGGYVDLGKFRSAAGQVKGSGLYLDAVGSVPLSGPWSALGKVGVFNGRAENSLVGTDRGTSGKVGAGLAYSIDSNLSVQGEWERYRFDTTAARGNTDLYSVGVKYRF